MRHEVVSCFEENTGIKLLDFGFGEDFINLTSKNKKSKSKNNSGNNDKNRTSSS